MASRIFYTKPSITDLEIGYANDAAANGWGDRCYEYIERFEAEFSKHLGIPYTIATSSCTGAMHMGLHAIGVGDGDEVVLADINWVASAAAVYHLGATPILVDIDRSSWCIDPRAAEAAITPKTKAIIATHIYGNLCDMDALQTIADKYGVALVEDAAEAIGSVYKGRRAGSIGKFGTFSFHGTKTITTGEGGAFVTADPDLYETVLTLSNHGRARGELRQFWASEVGFKYKISNIQAAIGCGQLERVEELVKRKRDIFYRYAQLLSSIPVSLNLEAENCQNGYWMPTVVLPDELTGLRDEILSSFSRHNIDGRVFFHPLSSLGLFESRFETPVSREVAKRAINLPSYHDITSGDIIRVVNLINKVIEGAKNAK